jgi:homoserine kinase
VACLLAACELWGRQERDGLVEAAARLEGHADNAMAAVEGGIIVAVAEGSRYCWARLCVPDYLVAVVAVPELTVDTNASRGTLPSCVRLTDAVFNLGRAALFVAAIAQRRFELLGTAMEDRLHQSHRLELIPRAAEAIASARRAGAVGAALSGSGPAVLALCERCDDTEGAVSRAMAEAFRSHGVPVQLLHLAPDNEGARVEPLT